MKLREFGHILCAIKHFLERVADQHFMHFISESENGVYTFIVHLLGPGFDIVGLDYQNQVWSKLPNGNGSTFDI